MAIRYFETNYFKSPFVKKLSGKLKCFYSYIICDCTPSGIWFLDFEAVKHYTGFEITLQEFEIHFVKKGKAIYVSDGKYFFPDFIEHQYTGGLSDNNKAHKNILLELRKYKLIDENNLPIKKAPLKDSFNDAFEGVPKGVPSTVNVNIGHSISNGYSEMKKEDFDIFHEKMKKDFPFKEPLFMTTGIKTDDALVRWLFKYDAHIVAENKTEKDYPEYRKHFKNWLNKQDTYAPAPIIAIKQQKAETDIEQLYGKSK